MCYEANALCQVRSAKLGKAPEIGENLWVAEDPGFVSVTLAKGPAAHCF